MRKLTGSSRRGWPGGRPSYVPSSWPGGRLNRWMAARPQRVLAWFAGTTLVAIAIIAYAAIDAPHFFTDGINIGLLASAGIVLVQAAVYVPRAIRATRNR